MKPDWDRLMGDFKDSPTALVGDVDCTAEGKDLCEKFEVGGYPTIKWGDPGDMKDYNGGRSYADFKKFADESLGPTCGPGEDIELCDAPTRKKVETFTAMSTDALEAKITKSKNDFEIQIPIMKKVLGYVKKQER